MRFIQFYRLVLVICISSCHISALGACTDSQTLQKASQLEMQYMLQRIPPAFADAFTDGQIHGSMIVADETRCLIRWRLMLPERDLAEAQAILQAQPAKRIMLAAQGYDIPAAVFNEAEFTLNPAKLEPQTQDTLQTAPLGKLRASVELMYAMITQSRADNTGDGKPWLADDVQKLNQDCAKQFIMRDTQSCDCRTQGLSAQYSARQVRYNLYLLTNPYAFAAGHGEKFKQLNKKLQESCGLSPSAS